MNGRFEVRETTKFLDTNEGWHEVTITDLVTGNVAQARAMTYEDAEREAWFKLKELQAGATSSRIGGQDYTPF